MIKAYFKDKKHLVNFFNKYYYKEIDYNFLESLYELYVKFEEVKAVIHPMTYKMLSQYKKEHIDDKLNKIREILENKDGFISNDSIKEKLSKIKYDYNYNEEFLEHINKLKNAPGLYFIYDINKNLVYIGKSANLSKRIFSSSKERDGKYVKYKIAKTKSDCGILELYYIGLLKPKLNIADKTNDEVTFKINYKFKNESDFIKVFPDQKGG